MANFKKLNGYNVEDSNIYKITYTNSTPIAALGKQQWLIDLTSFLSTNNVNIDNLFLLTGNIYLSNSSIPKPFNVVFDSSKYLDSGTSDYSTFCQIERPFNQLKVVLYLGTGEDSLIGSTINIEAILIEK